MHVSYEKSENFYSRKNMLAFQYRNDQELKLITLFEANADITSYEQFLLPIINPRTFQPIEEAIGFIIRRSNKNSYVLISNYLAKNPQYKAQIERMICAGKGFGKVTVIKVNEISNNFNVARIK